MNSFKNILQELVSTLKPNAVVGVCSSILVFTVTVLNAFFQKIHLVSSNIDELTDQLLASASGKASADSPRLESPTVTLFYPLNKD